MDVMRPYAMSQINVYSPIKMWKQHETQQTQPSKLSVSRIGWDREVHPEGVNGMARTGFSFRKSLVATLWPIS